ncbi:MAG: epoxyqueuosine reductase QueH [Actinomycetota bacterium]|nr:epoxyqueuosine reductase QueH [Actinomycetota bacterium]
MRLLLHVCCAPCLIYPLKVLKDKGFEVTLFFFNSNIDSRGEFDRRCDQVRDYALKEGLSLEVVSFDPTIFEDKVRAGLKERCRLCYDIRLSGVAQFAKAGRFDAFSTTLLVSLHQDQDEIGEAGWRTAFESNVEFIFIDFRQGFRSAQNEARELGLYIQNYCGCAYSKEESRIRRSKK